LQDRAALGRPIRLKAQNDFLETAWFIGHARPQMLLRVPYGVPRQGSIRHGIPEVAYFKVKAATDQRKSTKVSTQDSPTPLYEGAGKLPPATAKRQRQQNNTQ